MLVYAGLCALQGLQMMLTGELHLSEQLFCSVRTADFFSCSSSLQRGSMSWLPALLLCKGRYRGAQAVTPGLQAHAGKLAQQVAGN